MLRLFDYQELPQVDQIISLYLRLDDAHRSQFMDMGNYLAEKGTSPERLKKVKHENDPAIFSIWSSVSSFQAISFGISCLIVDTFCTVLF